MNRILIFLWLLNTAIVCRSQTVGGVSNIQGQSIPLDSFPNKKLLIVILPATSDTALAGQLVRFQRRHGQQVNILAIVASGALAPSLNSINSSYTNLPTAGIWLTEGMKATDSVGSIRQSVLRYISNKSRNRQLDPRAEGSKYFLSEKGRLFATLERSASLDDKLADYLVQTRVPGEDRF